MRTIYKYPLKHGVFSLQLPLDAVVIHVGEDPSFTPCVWVELDTEKVKKERKFMLVGTGYALPNEAILHLGSYKSGIFMWHLVHMLNYDRQS